MDVHEATCGLAKMLSFAVDVFRRSYPVKTATRAPAAAVRGSCGSARYHGNTEGSCKGARTLPCAPPYAVS